MHGDEEIAAEKNADVAKAQIILDVNTLQNAEDVVLVLLFLGALRVVPAIFNVELMKSELFRELVEIRGGGVGNVVPAQRWDGLVHGAW